MTLTAENHVGRRREKIKIHAPHLEREVLNTI